MVIHFVAHSCYSGLLQASTKLVNPPRNIRTMFLIIGILLIVCFLSWMGSKASTQRSKSIC